jgi:hypothetical protein
MPATSVALDILENGRKIIRYINWKDTKTLLIYDVTIYLVSP